MWLLDLQNTCTWKWLWPNRHTQKEKKKSLNCDLSLTSGRSIRILTAPVDMARQWLSLSLFFPKKSKRLHIPPADQVHYKWCLVHNEESKGCNTMWSAVFLGGLFFSKQRFFLRQNAMTKLCFLTIKTGVWAVWQTLLEFFFLFFSFFLVSCTKKTKLATLHYLLLLFQIKVASSGRMQWQIAA